MLCVSAGGRTRFRRDDRQHAFAEISLEFIKVEPIAETQSELIVVLHAFEVERLPVDPYDVRFARGDDEVGPDCSDFHPTGFYARNEHEQLQREWQVTALEVRLPVGRQRLGSGRGTGTVRWDDRMHERKKFRRFDGRRVS